MKSNGAKRNHINHLSSYYMYTSSPFTLLPRSPTFSGVVVHTIPIFYLHSLPVSYPWLWRRRCSTTITVAETPPAITVRWRVWVMHGGCSWWSPVSFGPLPLPFALTSSAYMVLIRPPRSSSATSALSNSPPPPLDCLSSPASPSASWLSLPSLFIYLCIPSSLCLCTLSFLKNSFFFFKKKG